MYTELLWIVPIVIALTDLVKQSWEDRGHSLGRIGTLAVAGVWGVILSVGAEMFPTWPEPLQLAIAGIAAAWFGSGLVKLTDYVKPNSSKDADKKYLID